MKLLDVSVLVYAHREDAPNHADYRRWLELLVSGSEPFAIAEPVLSGFLRVVTHPRVFDPPTTLDQGLRFLDVLREQATCVTIRPSERHWRIFTDLARRVDARGNLVPDAYLAALAIDAGCEWISTDRDFARFPGLRWSHPLAAKKT